MGKAIIASLQIILLLLKNKLEKDKEKRVKKENLQKEAFRAIKSQDISKLNALLVSLK